MGFLAGINSAWSAPRIERYEGVATHLDGSPAYRELHEVTYDEDRVVRAFTRYLNPDGSPRATLESTFPEGPRLPNYSFTDLGTDPGVREGVRCCAPGRTLEVFHQQKSRRLSYSDDWVTGQGFHYLAREALPSIARGVEQQIRFVIPSQLDSYSFRIRKGDASDPSSGSVEVVLEVQNWLLRLFAPSIHATYDIGRRRLLEYRGPSNLLDQKGDVKTVRIKYQYPEP